MAYSGIARPRGLRVVPFFNSFALPNLTAKLNCLFYGSWGFGNIFLKFTSVSDFKFLWQFAYFRNTSRVCILPVSPVLGSTLLSCRRFVSHNKSYMEHLEAFSRGYRLRQVLLQRYFVLALFPVRIKLVFVGMGYIPKLYRNHRGVRLKLGRNHDFFIDFPAMVYGICKRLKRVYYLILIGFRFDLVRNAADAVIRCRPPSPYTGRGVCLHGVVLRRKPGKTRVR